MSAEFRGSLQPCTVEAFPLRVVHPVVEDSEMWGEKAAPGFHFPSLTHHEFGDNDSFQVPNLTIPVVAGPCSGEP